MKKNRPGDESDRENASESATDQPDDPSDGPRPRRWRKRLLSAVVYLLFLLVAAAGIVYFVFYRPALRTLAEVQRPESDALETHGVLDLETVKRLGHVGVDKDSHFIHFATEKPSGIERLCAFGDSYTRGSETGPRHDFPSFLQRWLERRTPGTYQVINFGSAWHGFHQVFIAWEALATRYDCDRTLLGPRAFFPQRDTRFNHAQGRSPYYLHARYVLDEDNDLRLVEVEGDTHSERFGHYYRFLPPWRYLRYDRNPPFVLETMLPKGRTVENFAYYNKETEATEAYDTYEILLARMAAAGKPILLVNYNPNIVAIAEDVASPHLRAVSLEQRLDFPYGAPEGHNSAWGNALVAEQFAALLTGEDQHRPTILTMQPMGFASDSEGVADAGTRSESDPEPISKLRSIAVAMGDTRVGHFFPADPLTMKGKGGPKAFVDTDVVSLLAFTNPRQSLANAGFVPLEKPLRDGMTVTLRSGDATHHLGTVRLLSPEAGIGMVVVSKLQFPELRSLHFPGNADVPWSSLSGRAGWNVAVDGDVVLRGRANASYLTLAPVGGALYRLRIRRGNYVPLGRLPRSGTLQLMLNRPKQPPLEVPFARWTKTLGSPVVGASP